MSVAAKVRRCVFVVYITDFLSERKLSEAAMTQLQFHSVTTSQIT